MPAKKKPTPEPVPQFVVCSLCDEPWSAHQEVNGEISTLECIRLLKAKRYTPTISIHPTIPWRPVQPFYPWYSQTITSCSSSGNQATNALQHYNSVTPTIALAKAAS